MGQTVRISRLIMAALASPLAAGAPAALGATATQEPPEIMSFEAYQQGDRED